MQPVIDWSLVLKARWLPVGDEGIVMYGNRVGGVLGELMYVPWVQHLPDGCSAWYPVGYTDRCLYCHEVVRLP